MNLSAFPKAFNSKIAVIMVCHNRQPKTMACLSALFEQNLPNATVVKIYLLNDGSTDGTADRVQAKYPDIVLLIGDGTLFWNRGMHSAWKKAMEIDYDYYLWLNDDTLLNREALACLLSTHQSLVAKGYVDIISVGSTKDPQTQMVTYGGVKRKNFWQPLKFVTVVPEDQPIQCETMNGNCVLIPRSVMEKIGNLDPGFNHCMGDFDYGLRASNQNCSIWVAPGYLGECSKNSSLGTWKDTDVLLRDRFAKMNQPKGLPIKEWRIFAQRHAGPLWLVYWIFPYLKVVFTSLSFSKKKENI
jgi:GT2 family glycosyltransferase